MRGEGNVGGCKLGGGAGAVRIWKGWCRAISERIIEVHGHKLTSQLHFHLHFCKILYTAKNLRYCTAAN